MPKFFIYDTFYEPVDKLEFTLRIRDILVPSTVCIEYIIEKSIIRANKMSVPFQL